MSSFVLSSFSRKGYGSQARVSSFNLYYCRHWIHFISPSSSSSSSSTRGVRDSYPKSPRDLINTLTTTSVSHEESVRKIPSPWLMLPPAFGGNNMMTYKFYSLTENQVLNFNKTKDGDPKENICKHHGRPKSKLEDMPDHDADVVGSSHGWLALFNRSDKNMFLSDPVARRTIKLPPLDTLILPKCPFRNIKNVVLSCPPGDEAGECRAVMIYGPQNRLAFCCPGRGPKWDLEWTPIGKAYEYFPRLHKHDMDTRVPRPYVSVVYSSRQKLFFSVLTQGGEFEAWDLISDPLSPHRISMDDVRYVGVGKSQLAFKACLKKYKEAKMRDHHILVIAEHSDELFLVTQYVMYRMGADGLPVESIYYGPIRGYSKDDVPYKTIGFDVHRYDPVASAFKYMDTGKGVHHVYDPEIKAIKYTGEGGGGGSSLDGLALFIGANHGFALRADEYPGLKPNSIYFTDREYAQQWTCENHEEEEGDFGGHDVGIFSYEDGTFSPCYFPCDYESIHKIRPPPIWFTPNPPL